MEILRSLLDGVKLSMRYPRKLYSCRGRKQSRANVSIMSPEDTHVHSYPVLSHLYLSLFSRVFDGLEDVPCIPPSHLCTGYILTVPLLDQDSSSYSCNTRGQMTDCQKTSHCREAVCSGDTTLQKGYFFDTVFMLHKKYSAQNFRGKYHIFTQLQLSALSAVTPIIY